MGIGTNRINAYTLGKAPKVFVITLKVLSKIPIKVVIAYVIISIETIVKSLPLKWRKFFLPTTLRSLFSQI